jgi:hypothetical protein
MRLALGVAAVSVTCVLGSTSDRQAQGRSDAMEARYKAASEVMRIVEFQRQRGEVDIGYPEDEAQFRWSLRLAESSIAAGVQPARQAYAEHATRMSDIEATVRLLADHGRRSSLDCAIAAYFAADARALAESAVDK